MRLVIAQAADPEYWPEPHFPEPRALSVVESSTGPGSAPEPRVLLVTEGTYPFHWGGVSTWCDALIRTLPDIPFSVLAITAEPGDRPVFDRPANVVQLRAVPLWGLRDIREATAIPNWRVLRRCQTDTDERSVRAGFVPSLRRILRALFADRADAYNLADDLHRIYRFLRTHDLDRTLRSAATWQLCVDEMGAGYEHATGGAPPLQLWELTTALQWLSRWLFPLADEIPEVDVVHAAMVGICSVVAVVAKREHGAGFFLTEHGVYLRERYLAEAGRTDSRFLKLLGLRFALRMTEMSYALADQISPCCDYNQRWEIEVGAPPERLETIYYGIDSDEYTPGLTLATEPSRVVWVGRINPLKDVETLLRAAAEVVRRRPGVSFKLFGAAPAEDADYHERCLALHRRLGLGGNVEFCGYTDQPVAAYHGADIVVLSSISEGFPFSTLEAMLCGRPVVATAVGGIPEQIEGAGIVVAPRDPRAMADAIVALLEQPERCRALGRAARERAVERFAARLFRGQHYRSYVRLSPAHESSSCQRRESDCVPALAPTIPTATGTCSSSALIGFAADVKKRTAYPVDALEVAAILESAGVTDADANAHGFPDCFRLADAVFATVRESVPATVPTRRPEVADQAAVSGAVTHLDTARHPALALAPTVALLGAIWGLTSLGHWRPGRVVALTTGMTTGMLLTNGPALAMGRRASTLISLGRLAAARRFFGAYAIFAPLGTLMVTYAVISVPWTGVATLRRDGLTFVTAGAILSLVWILAAALSLVRSSGGTGVALGSGILVAFAIDIGVRAGGGGSHLGVAIWIGTVVVIVMLVSCLRRALRLYGGPVAADAPLPPLGYLLVEGLPYFLYGTLFALLFISVHLVGWAYAGGHPARLTTLELGLFLPLLPAGLGAGNAERSLRGFWRRAAELQVMEVRYRADYGRNLRRFYRDELGHWARSLVIVSAITVAMIETLLRTGLLLRVAPYSSASDLRLVYLGAVFAYAILGWGQFASMFCLSLLQPRRPVRAALIGAALTIITALVLGFYIGYAAMGITLSVGATAYALCSSRAVRYVLDAADHSYASAV